MYNHHDMAAITISRQMGTQGFEIAQAVGQRLGFHVVGRELINQAAIECGAPEIALATIDELGLLGIRPSNQAQQAYIEAVRGIVEQWADRGQVVIVGRAGQVILRGRSAVLHVRIYAPFEWRCHRIAELQGISLVSAGAQVEASDRARRRYLHRYYQARWDDPDLYHLNINNQAIASEACAEIICCALATLLKTIQ